MNKKIFFFLTIVLSFVLIATSQSSAYEESNENYVIIQLNHNNQSKKPSKFLIYAITETEYQKALEMKLEFSVEKTKQWLIESKIPEYDEIVTSESLPTEIVLPKFTDSKERIYYVLLQKQPDREDLTDGNFYQVFPSFISFDNHEEGVLVIETKKVHMVQTPYFFKYGSGKTQKPLEHAEFVFYRLNELDEKEYLVNIEPIEWEKNVEVDQAWQFKSDINGLVVLPDLGLDYGNYFFEETKAPVGYVKNKASEKIPLVISKTSEGLVMTINGEQLVPMQAGELPREIIKNGQPRILNDSNLETNKELKPPNIVVSNSYQTKKKTLSGGFLPKTGENKWGFSSLGLVLIMIGIIYKKRGRENE